MGIGKQKELNIPHLDDRDYQQYLEVMDQCLRDAAKLLQLPVSAAGVAGVAVELFRVRCGFHLPLMAMQPMMVTEQPMAEPPEADGGEDNEF